MSISDGMSHPSATTPLPAATQLLPSRSVPVSVPVPPGLTDNQDSYYPLEYPPIVSPQVSPAAALGARPGMATVPGVAHPATLAGALPFQTNPAATGAAQALAPAQHQNPILPSAQFVRQDRSDFPAPPASVPIPPAPAPYTGVDQGLQNGHTFSGLTNGVIAHPLFALVFKKIFEVCGSNSFDSGQLAHHYEDSDTSAKALQQYAENNGLDRACERWTSTDVFMSALVAALNSLQNSMQSGTPNASNSTLQHTIASAEKIINGGGMWPTDPRNVGATAGYPNMSPPQIRGTWRQDRHIQKGMHTHGSTTRTPLSEKAKAALERWFQENLENPYPTVAQKMELARICSMSLSSVNNWFGNKRMRIKRKMLNVSASESNFGNEGANSISDKVLAPRSKWNAVVVSKMNSQAGREVVASATGRANIYSDEHEGIGSGVIRTNDPPQALGLHDQRIHPANSGRGLENLP